MREILFKAKRKDNKKWVCGYPKPIFGVINPDVIPWKYEIVGWEIQVPQEDGGWCAAFEIIPETLCEFTGLLDKNGKMIFEGSIYRHGDSVSVVEWLDDYFGFAARDIKTNELGALNKLHQKYYEILGNKWDNPELLKGK